MLEVFERIRKLQVYNFLFSEGHVKWYKRDSISIVSIPAICPTRISTHLPEYPGQDKYCLSGAAFKSTRFRFLFGLFARSCFCTSSCSSSFFW